MRCRQKPISIFDKTMVDALTLWLFFQRGKSIKQKHIEIAAVIK